LRRIRSTSIETLAVVVATALSFAVLEAPALGQDASGFTISPPTVELSAKPGETITKELTVDNTGTGAQLLLTEVRNFTAAGPKGDQVSFSTEPTAFSLAEWIRVSPSTANLAVGGSQKFKISIAVPNPAPPGGHFGAIRFHPQAPATDGNVRIDQGVNSLILLRVSGTVVEKLSVAQFAIRPQPGTGAGPTAVASVLKDGKGEFVLRLNNEGNVHQRPNATVKVKNVLGQEVATVAAKDPGNTLPGSTREYLIPIDHKTFFGRYSARLEVRAGSSPTALVATTTFWVVSTGAKFVLVAVALAFIVLVVTRTRKARKKRRRTRQSPAGE